MRTFLGVLVSCALLAACAENPRKAPDAATSLAAPAGPPANDDLNAVVWAQRAIEHDLVYREVYRNAGEKLGAALNDPAWDALVAADRKAPLAPGLKPAVILDIDETVLDNSPYEARLIRAGTDYDKAAWSAWCREKSAKALPGALEFTQDAARRGITVFYVSNRAQDLADVTLENLRAVGFPIAADETVFFGLGMPIEGCTPIGNGKSCRRQQIGRTHRVLMQFGDQLGDLVDAVPNTPEAREAALAPYAGWIGERWFVLPNPTYGSWESMLFGNDWKLPVETRRKAKLDALRTQ